MSRLILSRARVFTTAVYVLLVFCGFTGPALADAGEVVSVEPTVESKPTTPVGDADDVCIWIHPTDPALSTVIGTDKERGLNVYGVDGREIQHVEHGHMNNVDLRYGFPLGGRKVAMVAASNKDTSQTIAVYCVDDQTRQIINVAARPLELKIDAYGMCMYHNPKTGKFYAIVNSYGGSVEQWELSDNGQGQVDGKRVREFVVGSRTEGCVCDDETGVLYIGEENVGIWKYPADPEAKWSIARRLVDVLGPKGHISDDLNDDIEGLTLYHGPDGTGYLIASCQGPGQFVIYKREGDNGYVGKFKITAARGIDAVGGTDGIDVTNANLGPAFPKGLFIAHDGGNENGDGTNFKFVPWDAIARAMQPPLKIDTTWSPRPARQRQ